MSEGGKIQNTKLRIERSTCFGQWKQYQYFSENIRPLVQSMICCPALGNRQNHFERSRQTDEYQQNLCCLGLLASYSNEWVCTEVNFQWIFLVNSWVNQLQLQKSLKGQLILNEIFSFFIAPKNQLENVNFCPSLLGQKFFIHFLGELKRPKSPSKLTNL